MHVTAKTLTIIGIPLLVIPALIICLCSFYYSVLAISNLKPNSKSQNSKSQRFIFIPSSEFTELGLGYRRRSFILALLFAAWWIVIMSYWSFGVWLIS
jgi:hypothetical protein